MGLVVEQLTSVRHRSGFEELSGVAAGRPVSVGITDEGLFPDEVSSARFAEAVRRCLVLEHATIARTLAIEPSGARRWAVLWERVDGPTVERVLTEKGPLLPDESVSVTLAVAQALSRAHAHGVVHGALAPEWVTLAPGGGAVDVHVAGFGLGLISALKAGRKPTVYGDVEALGALLHQLLTGARPQGKVGALPDAALHLGSVLTRCLGLDLSDRYRSVDEFVAALGEANRTRVSGGHVRPAANQPLTPVSVRTLGPWALEQLLGEGAMGQVFLARHTLLGRQAAIKVLRPEQYQRDDLVQRFFQEARSVNQINHEHIVEISDFGQELGRDGKPTAVYFVMELLQGETLTARLAKGPLSIARAVHVIEQLASALAAAHRLGVVHRDVKTDNVFLISRRGDDDYVKVLDFGVAKLTQLTPDAPTVSTMDGAIIGTPTSMSPEQASGGTVDPRADVYAVGVLLYLLLSGRLPIDADNFGKLIALLLTKAPDPLPAVTPRGEAIPPQLAALVMQCLEKDPAKRPQSMTALLERLASPVTVAPVEPPKRRGLVAALGVALVLGVGGAAWVLRPQPARVVTPPPLVVPAPVDAGVAVVEAEPVDAGVVVVDADEDAGVESEVDAGVADAGVVARRPLKPVAFKRELELLADATKKARDRFKTCLGRWPAQLPAPTPNPDGGVPVGRISISFELRKSGELADVTIKDPTIRDPLKSCLEGVMRAIKLPPHTGDARKMAYPVLYNSEKN